MFSSVLSSVVEFVLTASHEGRVSGRDAETKQGVRIMDPNRYLHRTGWAWVLRRPQIGLAIVPAQRPNGWESRTEMNVHGTRAWLFNALAQLVLLLFGSVERTRVQTLFSHFTSGMVQSLSFSSCWFHSFAVSMGCVITPVVFG